MILKGPRLIGWMSSKSTLEWLRIGWTACDRCNHVFCSFHHFRSSTQWWAGGLAFEIVLSTMFCRFSFSCILVWFNRRHYFQREPNYHTWHSTVVQTNLANCARGKRALSLQLSLLLIFLLFFLLWWLSLSLCFFVVGSCRSSLVDQFSKALPWKGFSSKSIIWHHILVGGFKYFSFSPLLGEDSQFD